MNSTGEYDEGLLMFAGSIPRIMGTRLEFLCLGASRDLSYDIWDRVCGRVSELDAMLDRFNTSSEVSRWNAGGRFRFSSGLTAILEAAEQYRERTGGLFDVSMGQEGFLDFGGIAKGYFLHWMEALLRGEGVGCALVNFGGSSILALGAHPHSGEWKIGLPHPVTGQEMDVFALKDCALSVSGNTPRYGGHIADPRTGERITAHRMVSVQGPDALDAEVLSTASMIANLQELAALEAEFPEYKIKYYG